MKLFRSVKIVWRLVFAAALLMTALFVVPVIASDGTEPTYPWDDALLQFGGVAIAVGALVRTLIQLAKHIQINGRPLLPTEGSIHLANVLLGGVLFAIVNMLNGTHLLAALLQSGLAVLAAIGGHELIDFLQSAFGGKSKTPSESSNPTGIETP